MFDLSFGSCKVFYPSYERLESVLTKVKEAFLLICRSGSISKGLSRSAPTKKNRRHCMIQNSGGYPNFLLQGGIFWSELGVPGSGNEPSDIEVTEGSALASKRFL